MQLSRATLIATAYFALRTYALPRPAASYSVVNVDGGLTSSALPTTVYQTLTESSTPETTTLVKTTSLTQTYPEQEPTTVVSIATEYTATWAGASDPVPTTTNTVLIPEVSGPAYPISSASTSSYNYSNFPDLVGTGTYSSASLTTVTSVLEAPTPTSSTSSFNYSNFPNLVGTATTVSTSYAADAAYVTPPSQWGYAAPTGTGIPHYRRAWGTAAGTGAWHKRGAWGTATGVRIAGRAAPTGWSANSWNETNHRW